MLDCVHASSREATAYSEQMTSPSRGPGRPTDQELTSRIVRSTLVLLAERGYDGLRIEHVASRARCGKSAIYRRYRDKPDLVASVMVAELDLGEMPDTGDLVEDLFEHVNTNRRNQRRAQGHLIVSALQPEVFNLIYDRFFAIRARRGLDLVERGVRRGDITADVDPAILIDLIAGLVLLRETLKGLTMGDAQFRSIIEGLVANPPRRSTPS